MTILDTERLLITELATSDQAFILELLNTPGWLQFIGDRNVHTLDDAANYLINGPMKSYQQSGFGLWLVGSKESNCPIGICGFIKRESLEDVDIGFAFLPAFEGKGYAFEAASACMNYGKDNLRFPRIVAITNTGNERSIRLLERLGMEFERMVSSPPLESDVQLFSIQY